MKAKEKVESWTARTPVIIDVLDGGLVAQVVREVLAEDLIRIETGKK